MKTMENKLKEYKELANGCWEYTGYTQNGYGYTSHGKKKMLAVHRCSYEFHIGIIPDNMNVSHSCDNRACINPKHLILLIKTHPLTEILSRYEIDKNGCWNYTGYKDKNGYPKCSNRGVSDKLVHRISFEFYVSKLEEGLFVCHKCDNPSCINPNHLFAGTQQDNMDDMIKKGRGLFGSKHQNSTLNEKDVLVIRKMRLKGEKIKHIASEFKVSRSTVYDVVNKRCWSHV